MFYRRKIILALIQLLNGEVEKTRLQKLLFLYTVKKQNPEYEFVPYKYGCYSYSVKADLVTMLKKDYLSDTDKGYKKTGSVDYLRLLKESDKKRLLKTIGDYGNMSNESLIKHTYINFPYYAINSTIAEKMLSESFYERIEKARPSHKEQTLFTIGYEGISLENYLNKLVQNNISLLVDVRKNPLSMKFGFSKTLLKKYCNSLNINYIHIPEVGIKSEKRQSLENQEDYDILFEHYKKTTLKESPESQEQILNLLNKYNRIALTCFESNICQCHRLPLAESLHKLKNDLIIKHI
tara:strand:+ start:7095 stop:7976 length:882 start_codon:yes stop_codon:yes gene_type:complete